MHGMSSCSHTTIVCVCVCVCVCPHPHQVVDSIIWLHLADLNEPLCEGGHHVAHEVVAERD